MFELMIEIIKIFRKYPVNPLVQTVLEKVHKQYLVLFVLREQTRYFRKVLVVFVINSNVSWMIFVFYKMKKNSGYQNAKSKSYGTHIQSTWSSLQKYPIHSHMIFIL